MAYDKVAITDTPIVNPAIQQPQMREERVIDPYRPQKKVKTGQLDSNVATNVPEEPKDGVEETKTLTLAPAAAALARKEQQYRQKELKMKAESEALAKEREELKEIRELKAKLEAKDFSAIESKVPYADYTNYLIEKGSGTTPEQEDIKSIKSEIEAVKKAQQEDVNKRFEAAVAERRRIVNELIDTDASFVRIKKAKQQEAVVQHILDTWEHDSVDLDPKQAAKEVDELLKERAQKWAELAKDEQAEPVLEKKELPPLKAGIKTLTNNMAATGEIKRPVKSFQGMSDDERFAEARRRALEKLNTKQG